MPTYVLEREQCVPGNAARVVEPGAVLIFFAAETLPTGLIRG